MRRLACREYVLRGVCEYGVRCCFAHVRVREWESLLSRVERIPTSRASDESSPRRDLPDDSPTSPRRGKLPIFLRLAGEL